ncbi:uncharacterized protein LOC118222852 [Anguilla anguilla]|uniref:Uncharacterized protein n=1 Tax=Anguilla anguilla TaxID=7936 RepID=A0A9D3S6I1_ANGAN|nr:uncharacterized protein LOC118222852 [Anguilla anguilla]KAG5857444.1 hypothetical protein ANANG_G00019520 [Anguilla anguilla]
MGSGGSRGKKVAPAAVTEVNVYQAEKDSAECEQKDGGLFKPFKIQKLADFNRSWSRARPDCHSEGNDSEFSAEDDDIEVELDRVMAEYENRRFNSKKGSRKKSFERSKTYGFCNTSRAYSGGDFTSAPQFHSSEPPGRTRHPSNTGSVRASDKELSTFNQTWPNTHYDPNTHSKTFQDPPAIRKSEDQVLAEEIALVPGCCDAPDLTLPVILYNGSEEDLMETIEREFS